MKIVAAAVMGRDGQVYTLPAPARHHHVLRHMVELRVDYRGSEQGFVTSDGTFVRRAPALIIARKAGQLLPRAPTDGTGARLYSEDVW